MCDKLDKNIEEKGRNINNSKVSKITIFFEPPRTGEKKVLAVRN